MSSIINIVKRFLSYIKSTLDFIQNYFKSLVFILILVLISNSSDPIDIKKANMAKIYLSGEIFSAEYFVEEVDDLLKDRDIKGVLVLVDSGGGAVAPSVEMSYAIKELTKKKKVVVYANGTMASGSYYASIWADKIIANPGSMIGSIGVIFQSINAKPLMEKLGISTQTVKAGEYKEVGTFSREWNQIEKNEINKVIKDTYSLFVNDVVVARKLDISKESEFANAHIFTANQALKVGLVDEIGTIYKAQDLLKDLTKVNKIVWKKKDESDELEKILENLAQEAILNISSKFSGLRFE